MITILLVAKLMTCPEGCVVYEKVCACDAKMMTEADRAEDKKRAIATAQGKKKAGVPLTEAEKELLEENK